MTSNSSSQTITGFVQFRPTVALHSFDLIVLSENTQHGSVTNVHMHVPFFTVKQHNAFGLASNVIFGVLCRYLDPTNRCQVDIISVVCVCGSTYFLYPALWN